MILVWMLSYLVKLLFLNGKYPAWLEERRSNLIWKSAEAEGDLKLIRSVTATCRFWYCLHACLPACLGASDSSCWSFDPRPGRYRHHSPQKNTPENERRDAIIMDVRLLLALWCGRKLQGTDAFRRFAWKHRARMICGFAWTWWHVWGNRLVISGQVWVVRSSWKRRWRGSEQIAFLTTDHFKKTLLSKTPHHNKLCHPIFLWENCQHSLIVRRSHWSYVGVTDIYTRDVVFFKKKQNKAGNGGTRTKRSKWNLIFFGDSLFHKSLQELVLT